MIYLDLSVPTMALAALQGWLNGERIYADGVFTDPAKPDDGDARSTLEDRSHHY
ncbi:MAG: hypothetical protein ACOH1R_12260 [Luteimonas sp.]